MSLKADPILFEHFIQLLHRISQIQPRRINGKCPNSSSKALALVNQWIKHLQEYYGNAMPASTCKIFFRLFFPDEDFRRRYDLQETTLARHLVKDVFGIPTDGHGAGRVLMGWSEYPDPTEKTTSKLGCLGLEVEKALKIRLSGRQGTSPSLQHVDELLDELASLSGFSNLGGSRKRIRRPRAAILRDIYANLDPREAKFMTQIILRDLRPVLYPLSETHTTRALLQYNTTSVQILTKWQVMKTWHTSMAKIYRARASFDEAANVVEALMSNQANATKHDFSPILGVQLEVPKSQKGTKVSHALSFFGGESEVWVETKYDGERMQIHIDLSKDESEQITIYSKSKRNSTQDRMGAHPIIRAALGLPQDPDIHLIYPQLSRRRVAANRLIKRSAILDAEVLPYSESNNAIDEFWRLRSLLVSTAEGVRHRRYLQANRPKDRKDEITDTQDTAADEATQTQGYSLQSNASDESERHLMVVFFDIMFLDGESLMDHKYDTRRTLLEQTISVIPGFVSLSHRERISFTSGRPAATKLLAKIFAEHIAKHEEGLVLKEASSRYNTISSPWVKLKRDYIPGYADTVDLVIVAAGWNKDRARELRVAPETFTTFFVAALDKSLSGGEATAAPYFEILFVVEYGFDREQLEDINLYIKTWDPVVYKEKMPSLPYRFHLPKGIPKPVIMFAQPLLSEMFGAGFSKDPGMKYYCLRFPRLVKIWRRNERKWIEGCSLEDYQTIARKSIGCESSDDWANRTVDEIWGNPAPPGPKDISTIEETKKIWFNKLLELESADVKRARIPKHAALQPDKGKQKTKDADAPQFMSNQPLSLAKETLPRARIMANVQTTPAASSDNIGEQHSATPIAKECTPSPLRKRKRVMLTAKENMQLNIPMSPPKPNNTSGSPFIRLSLDTSTTAITLNHLMTPPPSSAFLGAQPEVDTTTSPPSDWPPEYIQSSIVQFMFDAYVWIAKEEDRRRPKDRPSASRLLPPSRRLSAIYFLLLVCGCQVEIDGRTHAVNVEEFKHIKKCVIFVKRNEQPDVLEAYKWLIGALESWRGELQKEFFVFDADMLTYSSLSTSYDDVASLALWRSSQQMQ
ncbi:hypothetical protein M422DRAFT_240172 [Sphaerobolus stellatus SS14]|nr:hypothetical protein M422DRAFT_240172 [Sphaerobolus stellatus SS14]